MFPDILNMKQESDLKKEGVFTKKKEVLVIKAKHVGSCEVTCTEMTCEGTKSTVFTRE